MVNKDTLIRNRTQAEIDLLLINIKNNIPIDRNDLRVGYDYRTLNRIETYMSELSDLLNECGYSNTIVTKTNWNNTDLLDLDNVNRYIGNINILRNAFSVKSSTPDTPTTLEKLSINGANAIEQILYDMTDLIEKLRKNLIISGVAVCGQNRLWQQRFRRR